MAAIHLLVQGRVQGVSYRRWTILTATKLGLNGWVRNRRDGSVEMVLSGEEAAVLAMQNACEKGPALARVDKVEATEWCEPIATGFVQKETA